MDFSIYETEPHSDGAPHTGRVPMVMVWPLTPGMVRMKGTDDFPPRCVALVGELGQRVGCAIYGVRPGPCRELEAGSDACERARRSLPRT